MTDDLEELVRRMADGDRAAFDRFYRALQAPLYRFIRSRLNDPFHAADIHHDVFLDAWRGAGRFQGAASARSWLFAIAWRKVADHFRKDGRLAGEDELPDLPDDSPDMAHCMIAAQESAILHQCLAALKPAHRDAIELTLLRDMSYREVALITGAPEGTVKTRVHHAKQLLLRCLERSLGARR